MKKVARCGPVQPDLTRRCCDYCTAIAKRSGKRCRLWTCKTGPYCWLHTKSIYGLRIKPSRIKGAGLGLFATRNLPAGWQIPYDGEWIGRRALDARYPGDTLAPYAMGPYRKRYVDARDTNSGVARYANSCDRLPAPGAKRVCHNNTKFKKEAGRYYLTVCGPGRVQANDELYVSYGAGYWGRDPAQVIDCG